MHFLGVSKVTDFVLITYIQKMLDEKYGDGRIQCSIDSSTPQRGAAFGSWIFTYSFNRPGFTSVHISNQIEYPDDSKLPCNCPICKNITLKDINPWNTQAYNYIIYHNLFKLMDVIKFSDILVNGSKELMSETLSSNLTKILNSVEKIFKSNSPLQEFYKHSSLFKLPVDFSNVNKKSLVTFDSFFNK